MLRLFRSCYRCKDLMHPCVWSNHKREFFPFLCMRIMYSSEFIISILYPDKNWNASRGSCSWLNTESDVEKEGKGRDEHDLASGVDLFLVSNDSDVLICSLSSYFGICILSLLLQWNVHHDTCLTFIWVLLVKKRKKETFPFESRASSPQSALNKGNVHLLLQRSRNILSHVLSQSKVKPTEYFV